MCGIVGYIGGQQAAPLLLEGLGRLEHRGYDSAGLAVLSGKGRVLLRPSGTEPVIRVMVEGESEGQVRGLAQSIAGTIQQQAAA